MADVPTEADVRPAKKQRTDCQPEKAQDFELVRRGDAVSSNPEWCAQRYSCIEYFNENARDEDALQKLIAPLLKVNGGAAVVRALVGARALALHSAERQKHTQDCQDCAWKKCSGPLCHEMLHKDENCACGFGSSKGA